MIRAPSSTAAPLPPLSASALYLRCLAVNLAHRLVVRRVRSRKQVAADYDQGEWRDTLLDRRWERCATLADYVLGTDARPLAAIVDGRLSRISMCNYYAYRTERLAATLRRFAPETAPLVEIGSGAGRNLFALAHGGAWPALLGLELSPTGREVTALAAARFGLPHVRAEAIDLLDRGSPGFAHLRGATAFSFYCLEQLPSHTRRVLENLLVAGVRRVIHIEPTPELFERSSLKDLATISYIWRQDYQRTLVATARKMQDEGAIRVLAIERLGFAPSCRNDPTLVAWEPAASGA